MSRTASIIQTNADGTKTWFHTAGDRYQVTGIDRNSRRFVKTYDNWFWARAINMWHGSRWLLRDGKRILISRR